MRLADDWAEWASACEDRTANQPQDPHPGIGTLTAHVGDRILWTDRRDLATGEPVLAEVVALFR